MNCALCNYTMKGKNNIEDVIIILDKYKEVYTQLAAYAILWES